MISSGFLLALILIVGFIAGIFILDRFDLLEPFGLEMSGPLLMWKTKKGRDLIDRIAQKKRFWEIYGNIGLVVVGIAMVIIFLMVAFNAYMATAIPAEQAPDANEILVIPGVNPFIPVGYGILSLAVGIIVHEFSHGILSRAADVDIKSLGLIFLVVPLGAFVEPDEDQIEETERIKRDRMFAAGVTSNIVLAIILVLVFSTVFMGSVSAEEDGVMIRGVYEDTPAAEAEMQSYDQILEIDGKEITGTKDLGSLNINLTETNEETLREVDVSVRKGKDYRTYKNVTVGLVVIGILEDSPAHDAGLEPGAILYQINETTIHNRNDLSDALKGKDKISLKYWQKNNSEDAEYKIEQENLTLEDGLMGINMGYFGLTYEDADWLPKLLSNPLSAGKTGLQPLRFYFQNAATYIALPLLGLSPVPEQLTGLYEISGPLSALPTNGFWILANSIYWVFWLNILLGLFNALPAIPLDGGYLFQDGIEDLSERLGLNEDTGEKLSSGMTYALALLVLFLLMWSMIGPRI
ncbi:MAG: site-2 protease family protein [Candidatus Thermoplasmatota archaeon]